MRHCEEQQFVASAHGAPAALHPCASQRPLVHRPEQHWLCIVHIAFVCRQVPDVRHVPIRQARPVQQSVGCAHGSVTMRHCARQVPVGPQKPWQHSKSAVQFAPAMVQVTGRHRPETQEPVQQSFVSLHARPEGWQLALRQTLLAHVPPVQQSPVATQPPPGIEQPSMDAHRPATQLPEQHNAGLTQASFVIAHVHAPSRHSPLQHSFDDAQPSMSGLHTTWHSPPRHSPLQQSASEAQFPPSS